MRRNGGSPTRSSPRSASPRTAAASPPSTTRNALWGAWGNAAILAAEGRPDAEIADYLTRWALLTEAETTWALGSLRSPSMGVYLLAYFHGWRLLRPWLDPPDRPTRVRHLLTQPVLPADLVLDPTADRTQ